MSTSLSNYDEALKVFYLPAIQDQLNNDTILSTVIDTNETDVSGKSATIECHHGRSSGTGARADGGALPTAGYQQFQTATVPMRYNYGRVNFTGPTIAATRDERGSYARVIDTEIRGIVNDLKQEVNRQLHGCGYGVLARWYSGASGNEVVQKAYRGHSTAGGDGFGSTFGAKYLTENGAACWFVDSSQAGSVVVGMTLGASSVAVTDFTSGTSTDTLACSNKSTPTAGTYLARPLSVTDIDASTAAGGVCREMMGIHGICAEQDLDDLALFDGATDWNTNRGMTTADGLQGLAVGSYSWWKANVDKASSTARYQSQRALTFRLMQKMFDQVEEKAGRNYGPDLIMTTRAIRREYLELCRADRRAVNKMDLDGGWSALDYNGVPLVVDNDAIDGDMYFLTTKDLNIYRMSDYDWMERDGAILSRLSGYDAYEAVLFRYAELGCTRRNTQGVLCDLNYTL